MNTNTSLQYNVSQLLKGDVGEKRIYSFETDEVLDLDGNKAHQVHGTVKFTLTNFGVIAAVEAGATLDLTCARCLESFRLPVDVSFEDEYQPVIDIHSGLPSTAPRSDTAFTISPNHTIDLAEALRQQLLLTVEIIPVCRPDCKGLCATCGANLNLGPCVCPPSEEPSPFAALQGLLVDSEIED